MFLQVNNRQRLNALYPPADWASQSSNIKLNACIIYR